MPFSNIAKFFIPRQVLVIVFLTVLSLVSLPIPGKADSNGLTARGVVTPRFELEVRTELSAKVAKMPVRAGERFKKGEMLLGFDCKRYNAKLKSSNADVTAALEKLKAKRSLLKYKAIGSSDVKIAAAEMTRSEADRDAAAALVSDCEFHAPFDGRMASISVERHELSKPGDKLLTLISDRELEVDLVIPSKWLAWLKEGESFDFLIDETAREVKAKVSQLGARVDPVSRTIQIKAVFPFPDQTMLAGMSGTATFRKLRAAVD